jgi:hypothetical protein
VKFGHRDASLGDDGDKNAQGPYLVRQLLASASKFVYACFGFGWCVGGT